MLQSVRELLLPAAQVRLLLLLNHVVSREAVAVARLKVHAGRRLTVDVVEVPPWLPALPAMCVIVTAAGLFELDVQASDEAPDLSVKLPLPRPDQLLAAMTRGALPAVRIEGAAALAADMHWLADNLRWDIEADVAQAFGPLPARLVMSAGRAGAQALRRAFPGPGAP
jgi:ubiquinone biosynthesis accessory factor UbiJ